MVESISDKVKKTTNLLYENSDITTIQLGEKLGVSRQTASKYLKNTHDQLIFSTFTIENPDLTGTRSFFIEIKTNPEEPEIVSKLLKLRNTQSIDGIIGASSLIVRFQAENSQDFSQVLNRIDNIISGSRFQHYRIIECLNTFKIGGKIMYNDKSPNINQFATIKIKETSIPLTDFPFKFYLQIMPKNMAEYGVIAKNILAPQINISDLFRTGQEFGILAIVRTKDIQEFRSFIENIYRTGKIQDSITTLVIDEKMPATFKPFRENV